MPGRDDLQWYPLRFDKGANTTDEATILAPGECSVMENWEPVGAGVRPRASWRIGGGEGAAPASRITRGINADFYVAGLRKLLVSTFNGSANFILYKATGASPDAITGWTQVSSVAVSSAERALPMAFAVGNSKLVYGNIGFPSTGRARSWDGTTDAAIATNSTAGRTMLYYLNRFWSGGSLATPTKLMFSELGDETSWNVTENFIPVGQDDTEPIEDMVVFDRGLVIGKHHSLWWLAGRTPDSFSLDPITVGDISVAQGRSLCSTPIGVFVVGRNGGVWLWSGGVPKMVNQKFQLPVQTSGYVTTAWLNNRLYICQSGAAPVVVYDPIREAWWSEPHAFATDEGPNEIHQIDEFLTYGPVAGVSVDLMQYRRELGKLEPGTARDPLPDQNVGTTYRVTARPEFPKSVLGQVVVRELRIRYRQFDAVGDGFTVQLSTNQGVPPLVTYGAQMAAGVFRQTHTFGKAGHEVIFEFEQTTGGENFDSYAIEEALVGVQIPQGRA